MRKRISVTASKHCIMSYNLFTTIRPELKAVTVNALAVISMDFVTSFFPLPEPLPEPEPVLLAAEAEASFAAVF